MKRTQLQLDDATYREIKRRAFNENRSMAEVIRGMLTAAIFAERRTDDVGKWTRARSIVGAFRDPDGPHNVSERHDDYLDEAYEP